MSVVSLLALCAVFGLLGLRMDLSQSWVFLAAALLAWWLVPRCAILAKRVGAVAQPGGRQTHAETTPLFGGIAIFVTASAALLYVASTGNPEVFGVLAGGALVFGVGIWDDLRGAPPRAKVLIQILAAGCLLAAGFRVGSAELLPFGTFDLGWLSVPLVIAWVLLATNALNLIDGMDGLAGGVAILGTLTLALVGTWPVAMLAAAGGIGGFLYFNLPRARIFMGDAGSLFLGFLLAAAVLALPTPRLVPLGLALFAYPIGDVVLALARRIVRGQPLWRPDRSHIHHKLVALIGHPAPALLLVFLFVAVEILVALAYPGLPSVVLVLLGWVGIAILLVGTGQYTVTMVMATREPVQRMHAVTRYAKELIRLASRPHHIETALLHLVEGASMERLALPDFGIHVVNRVRPLEDLRDHEIGVCRGVATWTEPCHEHNPRVEVERETAVVQIVRLAAERLDYLTTDRHLSTVAGRAASEQAAQDDSVERVRKVLASASDDHATTQADLAPAESSAD